MAQRVEFDKNHRHHRRLVVKREILVESNIVTLYVKSDQNLWKKEKKFGGINKEEGKKKKSGIIQRDPLEDLPQSYERRNEERWVSLIKLIDSLCQLLQHYTMPLLNITNLFWY